MNYIKNILKVFIFCAVISILGCIESSAQTAVQPFEGEIRMGLTTSLGQYKERTFTDDFESITIPGTKTYPSLIMGLELRYNIPETKYDLGLFLELSGADHKFKFDDGSHVNQNNRTLAYGFTSHYNFRQGKKVNPFAGLALGFSSQDNVDWVFYPTHGWGYTISPRGGVELFHHLRLTAGFNITRKYFNNCFLTAGVVVGGRPKKAKEKKQ